ncbi:MAG: HK97 family phage prohead protease [Spirochaetota bacterium]|nr:HK97 family phage prohead protease [Spirochaetota bacterium]
MKKIEKRTYPIDIISFREKSADGEEKQKLQGHAAVFDQEISMYWFREKIVPGAFAKSIKVNDIRALLNHDPNYVLGRNKSNTLSLREDDKGLFVDIFPPDTQTINDLVVSPVSRGDITQMSFGFDVIQEEWISDKDKKDDDLRVLHELKLHDVSIVTFPAYEDTDIALRSHDNWLKNNIDTQETKINLMKRQLKLKGVINGH